MSDLCSFKLLSFDVYGTLIDWENGIVTALEPLISRSGVTVDRKQVLHCYHSHEKNQQSSNPNMAYTEEIDVSTVALSNSTFESGYGNLTGFHLSYQDAVDGRNITAIQGPFMENQNHSILPNQISDRAAAIFNSEEQQTDLSSPKSFPIRKQGDYFVNITGAVRGKFTKLDLSLHRIPMQLSKAYDYYTSREKEIFASPDTEDVTRIDDPSSYFTTNEMEGRVGNVTDDAGNVRLNVVSLKEGQQSGTLYVTLRARVTDANEYNEHIVHLKGIYDQNSGNLVASTMSGKFAGPFAVPHLSLSQGLFNSSKLTMLNQLNQTFSQIDSTMMDELQEESLKCEYVGFFHFPSSGLSAEELSVIEEELQKPLGRPHRPVPSLKISSGIMYSPDCGLALQVGELNGLRAEAQNDRLRRVILCGILLFFIQIYLPINQMNRTNTPSTLSRVSFWSISTLNLTDGSLCMLYLLSSVIFDGLYLPLAVSSFLAFILASVFELRYMIAIYLSQMNERNISPRVALQGTPLDGDPLLPTTQPTNATQQQQQPTVLEDESVVSSTIYTRFFFSLTAFSFVILNSMLWPRRQRLGFEYACVLALNSMWVPQIYRNVLRGSRKSLSWQFLLGTSLIRLIPLCYVNLYKQNPFYHHYDPPLVGITILWLTLQLVVLGLQEFFGPRFMLPDRLLPKAYDYHPVLSATDLEHGYGIQELAIDNDQQVHAEDGSYKVDCAICMNSVDLPVSEERADGSIHTPNVINRRGYMVTPCRHIFHSECLESWMKYKLQCPVCRSSLPPL